ncbi:phosphotransferase [Paraburkholderia fungorum]|uniref:phosphotransferase n=1 Tax=Paraburkholderia fungorum TaxID=134537 RepID=UPI003877FFCB
MLSKLRHFAHRSAGDLASLRSSVDVQPALKAIGAPDAPFARVNGGTLGVGFIASVNGRQQFLKCSVSADGQRNIEKEIRILSHLYGEPLAIRRIEAFEDDAAPRIWLMMDVLCPVDAPLAPGDTLTLVQAYRSRLASLPVDCLEGSDTLGALVEDAAAAIAELVAAGQISSSMHDDLRSRLAFLAQEWPSFPGSIAHGDLGPSNILASNCRPVAIDWEDAFLSVDGYDYLYWLTFFENRRYYKRDVLGLTPLGIDAEVALLAMILILKSGLALRANTHAGNQLTVEQRIGEVLALA